MSNGNQKGQVTDKSKIQLMDELIDWIVKAAPVIGPALLAAGYVLLKEKEYREQQKQITSLNKELLKLQEQVNNLVEENIEHRKFRGTLEGEKRSGYRPHDDNTPQEFDIKGDYDKIATTIDGLSEEITRSPGVETPEYKVSQVSMFLYQIMMLDNISKSDLEKFFSERKNYFSRQGSNSYHKLIDRKHALSILTDAEKLLGETLESKLESKLASIDQIQYPSHTSINSNELKKCFQLCLTFLYNLYLVNLNSSKYASYASTLELTKDWQELKTYCHDFNDVFERASSNSESEDIRFVIAPALIRRNSDESIEVLSKMIVWTVE